MNRLFQYLKGLPPGRSITLGFVAVILFGTFLLLLPVSANPGMKVEVTDVLFTSTSAVCVAGLIAIDTADHLTIFGRAVVALLIQIGGLGVTSVGVGSILVAGKRVGFKGRALVKEALNVDSSKGVTRLVKAILFMTLSFEAMGAALSFIIFVQGYPPSKAMEISIFHSIAVFNNSGFGILRGLQNLIPYQTDVLLNLVACGLTIFGGPDFLAILDALKMRSFKKLYLHSKVVITTSVIFLAAGTLLLKAIEDIPWLGAFSQNVSARTAGLSTYLIRELSSAGLFTLTMPMSVGASPGSTGGGIKTSTFFVLLISMRSFMTKKRYGAFHRSIPAEGIPKTFMIAFLSFLVVCGGTFLLHVLEPGYSFIQLMFEVTSAFGMAGFSTGITPELGSISKLVVILIVFISRLGAFMLASIWVCRQMPHARYIEESVIVG